MHASHALASYIVPMQVALLLTQSCTMSAAMPDSSTSNQICGNQVIWHDATYASGLLRAAGSVQTAHLGRCSLLGVKQKAGSNHTCPANTTPAHQTGGCVQSPVPDMHSRR